MIVQVGCILRTGGDYLVDHVGALNYSLNRHAKGNAELVCFTDVPEQVRDLGVKAIPLINNWPGWWSVPEVFRLTGPTVVVGLDTVFVREIDALLQVAIDSLPSEFWMIRNLGKGRGPASGIMVWNGDWSWLYEEFNYKESIRKGLRGDENYTLQALASRGMKPRILQDVYSDFCSYKQSIQGTGTFPDDVAVVVFHGKPRPHEIFPSWRRLNYPLTGERGRENG